VIIICNGMLRSGSTLQYNIAARVFDGGGQLDRVGFLGGFDQPEAQSRLERLRDSTRWSIVKTHETPLPVDFYDERVWVLFSYRDVRDIAASIRKKWASGFDKILADLDAMIEIERRIRDLPRLLTQPYDILYADLPRATREIAAFLSADLDEEDLAAIAKELSLDGVKERMARKDNIFSHFAAWLARRPNYDAQTLLHSDHISVSGGRDGDWRNQFSAEEIASLNSRYGSWLVAHHYAVA
jgi:hypothetical protein